jgi:nitrogen fixation/metabolism regulation signal transduction histidine kinase
LILLSDALVAVVLSRRTSAHLAEPITATTRVVNDIARGDFTRRVNADAAGEIGVLIESVNRMAEQLDDLTQRLTQSERVAAWRGVARRFAHELKNPLQPIAVSLYQIRKALDEGAPAEKVRSPLASIDEEIRHLTKLAERFSALSKMPPPDPKTEDLAALVKSIGDLYAEKLTGHGFRLSVTDRPVYAEIDPTYLREAIHNLLKNAEEATEAGDQIELSLTTATGRAVISVKDHGRGMNSEQMASARLPYFTTKQRGSGLGLAVVEKVAADSGGRLDIESAPETGTTARLIIPLTEQSGDQREDTDSR